MALSNYEYLQQVVLSKLKVGDTIYYLKDAEARAALEAEIAALGTAAYRAAADVVVGDSDNLVSAKAVANYVSGALGDVTKALIFRGLSTTDPLSGTVTIDGEVLVPGKGDVILYGTKEYVYDGAKWVELGDEGIYLTVAAAAQTYVAKTFTIAGIDMQDNITVEELKTALGLGALAYKNSASGTVEGQTISGLKASGNTAGSITVELQDKAAVEASLTRADYTPAGSITGDAISGGSINVTLKDAANVTAASISYAADNYQPTGTVTGTVSVPNSAALSKNASGIQIEGSISTPNIDLTSAPKTVVTGLTGGAVATWTGKSYTAPSLGTATTGNFATNGMVADIDTVDSEMLVLSAASTGAAVTAQGTFNPGAVDFGTFNGGELPVAATGSIQEVTAAALHEAPEFTGEKYNIGLSNANANINATFTATGDGVKVISGVDYVKQVVDAHTFTPVAANLGFSGTAEAGLKVSKVEYVQPEIKTASFTGAAVEFDVDDVVVAAKNVTVQ